MDTDIRTMPAFPLLLATLILPQPGVPTGKQILDRSAAAYGSAKTFEQEVSADINGQKGTAHIWFVRPGKMRVSGETMFGSEYDLLSDGKKTWVENGSGWEESQSLEMGIASITGISANAGTHVPAALSNLAFNLLAQLRNSQLSVSAAKLGGKDAFLVTASKPLAVKVWFDAKTSFYMRSETQVAGNKLVVSYKAPKVNAPIPAAKFKK